MTYEEALLDIVRADDRFVVMTAENRAAIRSLPDKLGERLIDVGICEQTLVGAAAGLALRGRIPVVHALAAFLTMRAFEFIRTDVGLAGLPVKLVGFVPGFLSEANGPTHQAVEDMALMSLIPGMTVFAPADEEDLILGLKPVLEAPGPAYIRFNARPAAVRHLEPFRPGRAEVLSHGRDAVLLAIGALVEEAMCAAGILRDSDIDAGVWNMRMLRPLDTRTIAESGLQSRLLVTIEDHGHSGGLGSAVSEFLQQSGTRQPLLRLGLDRKGFHPAVWTDILEHEKFNGRGIAAAVIRALNKTAKEEPCRKASV
jgi:transketolase